ncbi:MAG: hypothetical protein GXO96_11485 [Nitrospirae bacterium]|nr:hypothetical protein [Candidatus Manganitrophaceae bacterium]
MWTRKRNLFKNLVLAMAVIFLTAACAAKSAQILPSSDVPQVKTVAVLPFSNNSITHSVHTKGLERTVTDRIVAHLAGSIEITLIDREAIEKVLNELSLSSQGMTEAEGRLTLGKLLGANYLILGEYSEIVENLRLDARIVEVQSGRVVGSDSVQGRVKARRELETTFSKKVSSRLLSKVGIIRKTGALSALDYLRMGIQFEKKQEFEKALTQYKKALSIEPENQQAHTRLQAVLLLAIE